MGRRELSLRQRRAGAAPRLGRKDSWTDAPRSGSRARESSVSDPAFDTLGAARRLKAAGIEAEQAEAIVEVMGESVNQLVTVERFEAGLAMLQAQIDAVQSGLQARIDAVQKPIRLERDRGPAGLPGH